MTVHKKRRRKGVIIVFVVVILIAILAVMALAVDVGYYYNVKRDLQSVMDAAALAGASALTEDVEDPLELARNRAIAYAAKNSVMGQGSNPEADWGLNVQFGKWDYDTSEFAVSNTQPTAIRLTAQLTKANGNPVDTFFAKVVGVDSLDAAVSATAVYGSRDIVVTLDYSASMSYDSQLRHIGDMGQSEVEAYLTAIWNGDPDPDPDYPGIGNTRGLRKIPGSPLAALDSTDMNNASTTVSSRTDYDGDGDADDNDIMVALGLRWNAGTAQKPNWKSIPYPYPPRTWGNYFDYVQQNLTSVNERKSVPNTYRNQYGYLTFMDYLQAVQYRLASDNVPLWQTSQQPITAVKDAVSVFLAFMRNQPTNDRVGLASYTYSDGLGHLEVPLTEIDADGNWPAVDIASRERQAGHYHSSTNIAGGIDAALTELLSRGRSGALRLIVLLTDGQANIGGGKEGAKSAARRAAANNIPIVTIALGADADTDLMKDIADITGGYYFDVSKESDGTPYQDVKAYADKLKEVFAQIAGTLPLKLVN